MMDINTFVMANEAIISMSFFFGILGVKPFTTERKTSSNSVCCSSM